MNATPQDFTGQSIKCECGPLPDGWAESPWRIPCMHGHAHTFHYGAVRIVMVHTAEGNWYVQNDDIKARTAADAIQRLIDRATSV